MRNRIILSYFLAALLSLNFVAPTFGQQAGGPALPQGVEFVTTVEGISEYRLANGLRFLLFPDPSKQTITVNMTYLVGSRHENYGETGMAHLLEHLVFKGTPKHPNIPQELTEHGASPNGTTNYDRTNYFETFAASDNNLEWALDLESDRMVNSFIAKKDLDSEMTVVRNEMENGENNAARILNQRVFASAFEWHNYGKNVIGARADVENVPIDRLQAFYKTYYQPDNAVLTVAGKIEVAKTLEMIHRYFSPIPRPTRQLPKIYTVEPTQDGERSVTVRRVGETQNIFAAYRIPASMHPDTAALSLLGQIMSAAPSGPLYRALVEPKKATSASGRPVLMKDPGLMMFSVTLRKDQSLEAARDALLEAVENYPKTVPSKEDFERAQSIVVRNVDNTLTDPIRVGVILSDYIAQGDWRFYFLFRDRLKKATPEDMQRVAKKYLVRSSLTLGLFVPTDAPARAAIEQVTEADIAAMFKDFKGGEGLAAGEAFDPTPANIEARVKRSKTKSGFSLALLPKKNRGEKVNAILTFRIGSEKSLMNRHLAGRVAAVMLQRGTAKRTRQQIQDEFTRLKSRAGIGGDALAVGANIESTRENLSAAIRLAAELMREPSFPAADFEEVRQNFIAGYERQIGDPQQMAQNALLRHLNPFPKGDVREQLTPQDAVAQLKALTLDDVKKFYQDFYGAGHVEIAVVGDFDEAAVAPLVEELFGGWKSRIPFEFVRDVYFDVPAMNQTIATPDKANAYFTAAMNLKVSDKDPDFPALTLGNYILGGGFLNSRLATRIRQKEGLSYGLGSRLIADQVEQAGQFRALAIVAPENVAKLETIFQEELARLLKDGVTPEEVAAAKSGWLQSRQVGRNQDGALANKLRDYLFLNRTLLFDEAFEKRVGELTAAEVTAALRKHIIPAKLATYKAGDFSKVTK